MNWMSKLLKIITSLFKVKSPKIKNTQDNKEMTVNLWLKLPQEEQEKLCQSLTPYKENEWEIFKTVEKEFIREFGDQPGIGNVRCSLGPMLGPYNCINVDIVPGQKKQNYPKHLWDFLFLKIIPGRRRKKQERPEPASEREIGDGAHKRINFENRERRVEGQAK